MSNWDRTYKTNSVHADGRMATINVWTAINDHDTPAAVGKLTIEVDTDHGSAKASLYLTPDQMRETAMHLLDHATRLEVLTDEITRQEAA